MGICVRVRLSAHCVRVTMEIPFDWMSTRLFCYFFMNMITLKRTSILMSNINRQQLTPLGRHSTEIFTLVRIGKKWSKGSNCIKVLVQKKRSSYFPRALGVPQFSCSWRNDSNSPSPPPFPTLRSPPTLFRSLQAKTGIGKKGKDSCTAWRCRWRATL